MGAAAVGHAVVFAVWAEFSGGRSGGDQKKDPKCGRGPYRFVRHRSTRILRQFFAPRPRKTCPGFVGTSNVCEFWIKLRAEEKMMLQQSP